MKSSIPFRVDHRAPRSHVWEEIAGFNVDVVAKDYADQCASVRFPSSYRVRKGRKVLHTYLAEA